MLGWALPLAFGAVLLTHDMTEPWTGSYDANGARESIAARNHLRYGLVATRGGQVVNAGQLTPERFRFYAHHPSGLSLTIAASFALLGEAEWSARLVPIAFTLGAAAFLYLVARELAGPWAGFFATLVFVAQPMVAFYGRMPDHEAPAAFFALLLTWLYLRWARHQRRGWLIGMCAAAFVGVSYAWVVAVVPWVLLGCHVLVKRRGWRWMLAPVVAGFFGFLHVLLHIALLGELGGLWDALVHRLGSEAGDRDIGASFGFVDFLARQGVYAATCFGLAASLAALAWLLLRARRQRPAALLVAALLAFALVNVVGFRQGAYVHIYYQFYLALPLALAAGLGLDALCQAASRRRWLLAAAAVVAALIVAEGWWKLSPIRQAEIDTYARQIPVARAIRSSTSPEDQVLLLWRLRASFQQLTYYADRDVSVTDDLSQARRRALFRDGAKCFEVVREPTGDAVWPVVNPLPRERPRAPGR